MQRRTQPVCFLSRPPRHLRAATSSAVGRPISTNATLPLWTLDADAVATSSSVRVLEYWNAPEDTRFTHDGVTSCAYNSELGQSHVTLPVVHQTDPPMADAMRYPRGMWYFYARGCSDVRFDTGRSFVAANRLSAILQLYMLEPSCNRTCAATRVVDKVTAPTHAKRLWGQKRSRWPHGNGTDLSGLVRQACDATIDAAARPCPLQAEGLAMTLAGSAHFDLYMPPILRHHGYDSLQLLFQPKGGSNKFLKWHTEIWDVTDASVASRGLPRFQDEIEREMVSDGGPDASGRSVGGALQRLSCQNAACVPSAAYRRAKGRGCLECATCETGCSLNKPRGSEPSDFHLG